MEYLLVAFAILLFCAPNLRVNESVNNRINIDTGVFIVLSSNG